MKLHIKRHLEQNIHLALVIGLVILLSSFVASIVGNASPATEFQQTLNSGTLTTDIRDASRNTVASPQVSMSVATFSFDCQSGVSSSTGTLGSNSQRLYVDNPSNADNGWTLTVAPTSGSTTTWTDGTKKIDLNDGTNSGCSDGADTDTASGQLTIDPSAGTITSDCTTCSTSNISKGSIASLSEGVTNVITLLNAAASSDNVGRWYLTGADVKQTIPAEQEAGNYTLNMTVTVTAQ